MGEVRVVRVVRDVAFSSGQRKAQQKSLREELPAAAGIW